MTDTQRGAPGQPDQSSQSAARGHHTKLLAAAAAVVLVVAGAAVWAWSQRGHTSTSVNHQSGSEATAMQTATGFVDALSSFDVPRARHLLAPGATFSGAVDSRSWAEVMRFFHQTGGRIIPDSCFVLDQTSLKTVVDCPYSYQLMRSGDLGLGPYTGSTFEITTRNGQVTHVYMDHETDTNGWSSQMWTPFATWIDTFHHHDGATMYPDWPRQHHWPATNQAIRLWSERTRQFVHYARHLCSTTHPSPFAAVCSGQPQGG